MEITLEEFQEAAKERKIAPGCKPHPYTAKQREFVLDYARRELGAGSSRAAISRTLGISDGTLTKWLSPEKTATRKEFRRVQVKRELHADGDLVLVTPGGYRVEGLDLPSAADHG